MVKVLDAKKLRRARGTRSRQAIVDASGKLFSVQQIYAYERGISRPRPEFQPALLKALGVEFDDVASPVIPAKPTRARKETAAA
jgi:hypothetical protein